MECSVFAGLLLEWSGAKVLDEVLVRLSRKFDCLEGYILNCVVWNLQKKLVLESGEYILRKDETNKA